MTREKAIGNLIHAIRWNDMPKKEALDMAIEALEQEPCEDAISRDMALEKMADYVASGYADSVEDFEEYSRIICQLSSVNPQPKTGHWSHDGSHWKNRFICSECGYKLFDEPTSYCPNCGAKMVEPQESEET